jgi:ankyrin repeat protein
LHVAATNDSFLSAKFLLTHGADATILDRLGRTAVDEALRMESHQLLSLLRGH